MHLPNLKEAQKRTNKEVKHETIKPLKSPKFQGQKFFLRTYGCQMNVHDSENIKAIVSSLGFDETTTLEESDLVILNTCAIRENAHDKVFGYLGRIKHLKETKPNLIVAITGCMSQLESVTNLIKTKYPFVNIVIGTHNLHLLGNFILEAQKEQTIEVCSTEGDVYEGLEYNRDSKYSAWVNIMYGCDKFCTYCIVPYTRGKQRSRYMQDILEEVNNLVASGYLEITLLGQNVNAYGKDLAEGYDFADLLEKVAQTNIPRLRFVTSHPWDFTDKMLNVIAKYPNIMPYIHLPIQSGSSKILKLMGRRYTKEEYLELFNKIKKTIPNVCITTDIIVGFPNETEEDFQDTLDIVNTCQFDGAFTFIYSPREGTPASLIKDEIPLEVKEERLKKLNELVNFYSLKSNQKFLNKKVKVLITDVSEKDATKVCGYTEEFKLVNVEAPKSDIGKIIDVEITDAKSFSLDGKKTIFIKNS